MIAIDTETTGKDLYHGAKPFLVTICKEDGTQQWWEWDVDPLTREPIVPADDLAEIEYRLRADEWILQNAKFDYAALRALYQSRGCNLAWDWDKIHDTLISGHVLASNMKHDLTSMTMQYLRYDIQPFEDAVKVAVQEARRIARSTFPEWRIAREGLEEMPSAKSSKSGENKDPLWKNDMWILRAMAKAVNLSDDHPWWTLVRDYANADSSVTLPLWKAHKAELERRGLWKIYEMKRWSPRLASEMETRGVTVNGCNLFEQEREYRQKSDECHNTCVNIAVEYGYDLEMPKGASPNNSLRTFIFDFLQLEKRRNKKSKSEMPTLDAKAMEFYRSSLEPGVELDFITALTDKRKRDTALSYMASYKRFWLPLDGRSRDSHDWFVLHPNLNPTGTDTLRWSSSNPNEQNISKREGFNLRKCFGPAPGREWWSIDAQNIELRIPAFEAGEEEMMRVFLHPKDPPYFGSYHLLVFDTLHPELYAQHGVECKTLFESTWYQWVKNGNFAIIYGAQEDTADSTYHVPGAFEMIRARFPKIAELADRQIEYAETHGYVETIPDRDVCPERGYPLLCTRSEWGKILPTIPLNYHVSGTAMQWMQKAMYRVHKQHVLWNEDGGDYHTCLQVHDELVLDYPKRADPKVDPSRSNLPRVRMIQKLMEMGGDDIGVPTPCAVEYHPNDWSVGIKM